MKKPEHQLADPRPHIIESHLRLKLAGLFTFSFRRQYSCPNEKQQDKRNHNER